MRRAIRSDPVLRSSRSCSIATTTADAPVTTTTTRCSTRPTSRGNSAPAACVHTLITGTEPGREQLDRFELHWTPIPAHQARRHRPPRLRCSIPTRRPARLHEDDQPARTQRDTAAFYAQDQIELSERWKLPAGLRRERFKAGVRTVVEATGLPTAAGRSAPAWSPTPASISPMRRTARYPVTPFSTRCWPVSCVKTKCGPIRNMFDKPHFLGGHNNRPNRVLPGCRAPPR